MANSNRGFAGMDSDKQRDIAASGGRSQGKDNNPGNFANRTPEDRQASGRSGGQARGNNNSNNGNSTNSTSNTTMTDDNNM